MKRIIFIALMAIILVMVLLPTVALAADGAEGGDPQIDLTEIAIAVVGLVFSAVIIPLTRAVFAWLKGKTQNEALRSAIDEAQTIADNVIARLQSGVVDGWKEESEDGKLTAEEATNVMEIAINMVISDLSAGALQLIENNADDITTYLSNLIEARLLNLKATC